MLSFAETINAPEELIREIQRTLGVDPERMTRRKAIAKMNDLYGGNTLSGQNSNFANINAAVSEWWLDIPKSRFEPEASSISILNLLLYDFRNSKLHHLAVPTD